MKSITKRLGAFAACAALTTGIIAGTGIVAFAENTTDESNHYFSANLKNDAVAQNFYNAFEKLGNEGAFKNGTLEYDLIENNVLDTEQVDAYINGGSKKIPQSYGAGRDAYIMDHPDLFYADLFATSISAGQQGSKTVAFLDTSRAATLYTGGINSKSAVDTAIQKYESRLTEIVRGAKAAGEDAVAQIKYVNKYIVDNTEYSFGTTVQDGRNIDGPEAAYISTAYGSLVNGKAICGGYSKGFKAVMDRLDIPCVCVQGYSVSGGKNVAHMWNYVEVEGLWYAVDVTFNDGAADNEKWLLVGGDALFDSHIEDNVISSSGYELKYPAIKPYNYGVDSDDNGMEIKGEYDVADKPENSTLTLTISFDGKGVMPLQKEGKYMGFRFGDTDKETKEIKWSPWFNFYGASEMFGSAFKFTDTEVFFRVTPTTGEYFQFALIDYAPDVSGDATYPDRPEYGENAGKECFYYYDPEKLTYEHFIGALSSLYHNNLSGSYVPAPGGNATPSNTGTYSVDKTYDIKIVYTDDLEIAEGKTEADVFMDFITSRGNDTVKQHAQLTNFKWDGKKTITFTFTPSKMYIHNAVSYDFVPANLVGKKSKKVPLPVSYFFGGKSVVCSKIFNDGRLYMNVFGQPKMLDTSDLSVTDFKDENGNYYAQSQRSQLILVANKPSAEKEQKMDEMLKKETPVKEEDIVSSTSYEIDLQICGVVQKVPNGSYMQVAFGFPEGYSPDDAGTTFKIYHYKHDDKGNITGVEEIPVIITEYGLIAKVQSFSPFTLVQLKKDSDAVTQSTIKNVYASVTGAGGTVTADGKGGICEVTGDTITYDLKADSGYQVGKVVLNGKTVSADRIKDGKLTLNKSELEAGNMLEVTFVTEQSVRSYAEKGIVIGDLGMVATAPGGANKNGSNAGVIAGCIIGAVVIAGAASAIAAVIVLKKKQSN